MRFIYIEVYVCTYAMCSASLASRTFITYIIYIIKNVNAMHRVRCACNNITRQAQLLPFP